MIFCSIFILMMLCGLIAILSFMFWNDTDNEKSFKVFKISAFAFSLLAFFLTINIFLPFL